MSEPQSPAAPPRESLWTRAFVLAWIANFLHSTALHAYLHWPGWLEHRGATFFTNIESAVHRAVPEATTADGPEEAWLDEDVEVEDKLEPGALLFPIPIPLSLPLLLRTRLEAAWLPNPAPLAFTAVSRR